VDAWNGRTRNGSRLTLAKKGQEISGSTRDPFASYLPGFCEAQITDQQHIMSAEEKNINSSENEIFEIGANNSAKTRSNRSIGQPCVRRKAQSDVDTMATPWPKTSPGQRTIECTPRN
jgi:hypothetical protein